MLSAEAQGGRFQAGEREDGNGVAEEEKPWHLHLARYLALGMSQKEAAEACDCSVNIIGKLLNTPWFCERVQSYLPEGRDIMTLIKAEVLGALTTLVTLCNDPKVSPSVRVTAAKDLLDRHLGKPVQRVEMEAPTRSSNPVAEAERLEAENARLESSPSTQRG